MALSRSPLNAVHRRLGAKMVEFGGWEMPLHYSGALAECNAVRTQAGLFDVSHLGKILIFGEAAGTSLDYLLPGKVAKLVPGAGAYNLVLNAEGGIVDDVFVYRISIGFIIVPNASNADAVLGSLQSLVSEDVQVMDARKRSAILALSGPKARDIVRNQFPHAADLSLHQIIDVDFQGSRCWVARSGYTGEVTFEFFVETDRAEALWSVFLEVGASQGLMPAGLGARDLLRLEMGYPLHGHEIDETTNPFEAGLAWVIDWDKEFAGRSVLESLRSAGPDRLLTGMICTGKQIPRQGQAVLQVIGGSEPAQVGVVTSGNYSPTLKTPIALGYVKPSLAEPGTPLAIQVRDKTAEVRVIRPPFVKTT
ncbi:MAG: glycine cleavage system aminomethyltransferase GcvT [Actinomycetota bacterium]